MENKENETESNDIIVTDNYIKIPIYLNGEKYLINIYPSKDDINIVFKIEKDKIKVYYYFSKFDLKEFKTINKIFLNDDDIHCIFLHLQILSKKSIINSALTDKGNKIIIIFQKEENKKIKFILLKRIVSQEKINPILVEQIYDNKYKINKLKNQIIEINNSLKSKNDLINNINKTLTNLNETLNKITNNPNNKFNRNNSNTFSTKNSSIESNSISENNSINNNSINNNEDEYQEENIKEKNNNINNNNISTPNQKDNNNNKSKDNTNNNNKTNNPNGLFCYEPSQNKKIIEFLVIFNIVTIFMVLYIIGTNYNLRINLDYDEAMEERGRGKKIAYISYVDNSRNNDNFIDIFQDNLDIQKSKEEAGITNTEIKNEYFENRKKKLKEKIYNDYDYI